MQQLTVILIGQYILTAILKNNTNKQGFIYNKFKKKKVTKGQLICPSSQRDHNHKILY